LFLNLFVRRPKIFDLMMNIDKTFESAIKHYQTGNLGTAESLCQEILEIQPQNFNALLMLGVIFHESGDYDLAITYTERSLEAYEASAVAHYNLGISYQKKGQPDKAISYYQRALALDSSLVSACYNLGSIFQEKGLSGEALMYYQRALELDPGLADAVNNIGIIFQAKGRPEEAITYYQRAIELDPNLADAYYNLGKVLQEKGEVDDAAAKYEKALQLQPGSAEACNNLGLCLQEKRQFDEALVHFRKAADLDPGFAEAYYNLALYHQDRNLIEKALGYYAKAIELKPDFVDAHWNMACALLLSGNFGRGWREYEWRWKLKEHRGVKISGPQWDGSDISGRTVLLHAEQGFGDAIQFVRYAPLVAERGASVILQCPEELVSLFRRVRGIEKVVADGMRLPRFDLHCPLLSLPLVFGTTLENIPAEIPYITADSQLSRRWRDRLQQDAARLKIGLVWAGRMKAERERRRSCSLELFSSLSHINGITFYSLQKGERAGQANTPPTRVKFVDFTEEIHDFADTAALIDNLDLVISVDTAVAHLAGALGKPVWTLIPYMPDWRWLLARGDSPWYPTMRLFRQPAPGDWEAVINCVDTELRELVARACDRREK
jgi:tetratricopeptide (TPR) repeat protein